MRFIANRNYVINDVIDYAVGSFYMKRSNNLPARSLLAKERNVVEGKLEAHRLLM